MITCAVRMNGYMLTGPVLTWVGRTLLRPAAAGLHAARSNDAE